MPARAFDVDVRVAVPHDDAIQLVAGGRIELEGDRAVAGAAAALAAGAIVAIKGAGGFVLAVDATSEAAVTRLRERKRQPHKPFAVMGRSLLELERIVVLDDAARRCITSSARPIVLVPARLATGIAPSVAPRLGDLGVLLPPTELQALVLAGGPPLQVMTSGNRAGEPTARSNAEAFARLADLADLFLVHDLEVDACADDSVVRAGRVAIPIRRARGAALDPIALPVTGPAVLAVGGHEHSTVCLAEGGRAMLSPHVGDLDHPDSDTVFRDAIARLRERTGVAPVAVAHDLHPDYRSTRWALASGLPRISVQHHHAHVAACLVDHHRRDRVLGIVFDDAGLGDDGALWGGEILDADLETARRCGHLRPLALAGGEAAVRSPWRLAIAALIDAGESLDVLAGIRELDRARVCGLLETSLPVRTTGAGRWFDAVAALLGIVRETSYAGQAAAELEAIAGTEIAAPLPFAVTGEPFEIDLRPMVRELAHELRRKVPACVLASRFHATLAVAIRDARRRVGRRVVALTGGCFQNRRLLERTTTLLQADDCEVLVHRHVPPNDGGLALGQAAIATARLARRTRS